MDTVKNWLFFLVLDAVPLRLPFTMSSPTEPDCLSQEELDFRLKGRTHAGQRWNKEYEGLIAEYETALVCGDAGWASDTATEVHKCFDGMQRKIQNLAKAALFQKSEERSY